MGDLSPHFSRKEFKCPCCNFGMNDGDVSSELIHLLEAMREDLGGPIRINSGCRCPARNAAVGGVPNSAHLRGTAADIHVEGGAHRRKLMDVSVMHFASGIGIAKTFVHVDVDHILPRPSAWSY
jgi:zinc D-Ala-D-Ala carboxypeptidase